VDWISLNNPKLSQLLSPLNSKSVHQIPEEIASEIMIQFRPHLEKAEDLDKDNFSLIQHVHMESLELKEENGQRIVTVFRENVMGPSDEEAKLWGKPKLWHYARHTEFKIVGSIKSILPLRRLKTPR